MRNRIVKVIGIILISLAAIMVLSLAGCDKKDKYEHIPDVLFTKGEDFEEDVYDACSMHACVTLRDVPGGPAPDRVRESIAAGEKFLAAFTV